MWEFPGSHIFYDLSDIFHLYKLYSRLLDRKTCQKRDFEHTYVVFLVRSRIVVFFCDETAPQPLLELAKIDRESDSITSNNGINFWPTGHTSFSYGCI